MFNVARYGNVNGTGTESSAALAIPAAYALMSTYLNLPDFCDYIITNYYGGNADWDYHNFSWIYNTASDTGSVFQDWDGEGMLLNRFNGNNAYANLTGDDTSGDPTELFVDLLANADFRAMFADHINKDLTTVLSPTTSAAMYQALANTVSTAIIDQSARWGTAGELAGQWSGLGTPAVWQTQLNVELDSFFPTRTATMFSEFEAAADISAPSYKMYPSFGPPALGDTQNSSTLTNSGTYAFTLGDVVTMTATTGAIYYTTDGSDPRTSSTDFSILGITLSGTTATVTLNGTSTGLVNLQQVYIGGAYQSAYDGMFTIGNVTVNSTAGTTTFTCTVTGSPASPATAVAGESLVATTPVGGAISSTAHLYAGPITLTQGEQINARVYSGGTWSALTNVTFYVNLSPYVRVTEVMYDPVPATPAEVAAGYTVSDTSDPYRDFQYIEIQNTSSTQTVPVGGLQISGGVSFTFPEYEGNNSSNPLLEPGAGRLPGGGRRSERLHDTLRRGAASAIRQQLAEPGCRRPVQQPSPQRRQRRDRAELAQRRHRPGLHLP